MTRLLTFPAQVMIELAKRGGRARPKDLAHLGSHIYHALQKLVYEGLLAKEGREYVLTEKGWKELEKLLQIAREIPLQKVSA